MSKRSRANLLIFVVWMALIFTTSCFFIDADSFVHFMQRLSGDPGYKQAFARFWFGYGIFVVKGWHATEYAILLLLCAAALKRRFANPTRAIQAAFIIAVLFAASDEWHQTFVPGRDGCVRDVCIDSAGAALAAFWLLRKSRKAPASPSA